jgi:hypothetical protein
MPVRILPLRSFPPASVYQNGLAVFTATAGGATPISLQWQCNGTNLPGQTLYRLILSNLQTNQTGVYTLLASNVAGTALSAGAQLTVLPIPANRGQNVLTAQHDNARTGADTNELILTPTNVGASGFGRLFSQTVDGAVYAQPLYVGSLKTSPTRNASRPLRSSTWPAAASTWRR